MKIAIANPHTFVALVVGAPDDGGELAGPRVRRARRRHVVRRPEGGGPLHPHVGLGSRGLGNPRRRRATGSIRLTDGTTLSFDATRADGIAGLYEVELADDRYQGSSYDGDRIEALIEGVDTGGARRLDVTFTSDSGPTQTLAYAAPSAMAATRWIILADGRLKGIDTHPTTVIADGLRP